MSSGLSKKLAAYGVLLSVLKNLGKAFVNVVGCEAAADVEDFHRVPHLFGGDHALSGDGEPLLEVVAAGVVGAGVEVDAGDFVALLEEVFEFLLDFADAAHWVSEFFGETYGPLFLVFFLDGDSPEDLHFGS